MPGVTEDSVEVRATTPNDGELIKRVLALASDWRSTSSPASVDGLPTAYFAGWGKADDVGVIASRCRQFVGGAYARRVESKGGTYGYVSSDLLELTIGVEPGQRGRGIGRTILETLKTEIRERKFGGLSLSVARENEVARRLYVAAGFAPVDLRSSDVLMIWRLMDQQ